MQRKKNIDKEIKKAIFVADSDAEVYIFVKDYFVSCQTISEAAPSVDFY